MENPMLDFEMEQSEKLKKAFYEGYEAGKKDAEYYALHCGNTDEPITNADRIRAMSDEEMAEEYIRIYNQLPRYTDSWAWLRDWLKQEATP